MMMKKCSSEHRLQTRDERGNTLEISSVEGSWESKGELL